MGDRFSFSSRQCSAKTRKGKPCPIVADRACGHKWFCHVHDPNGIYQQQQRLKPRGAKMKSLDKALRIVERRKRNHARAALTPDQIRQLPKPFKVDPTLPLSPDEIQPCDRPPFIF